MVQMEIIEGVRILHLCNKMPFPGRDGSSIAMESLIRLEQGLGHDVTVVALNTDKHRISNPKAPDGVQLFEVNVSIRPTIANYLSRRRKQWSYFASRFYHREVVELIAAQVQYHDIVVVDSLFMAVYLGPINLPIVIRAHNIESELWKDTLRHMPVWKRVLLGKEVKQLSHWERSVLSQHPVWAITPDDLAMVQAIGGHGAHIPCSIRPNQWPYSGATPSGIYHLGAMDWFPNIEGMQWLMTEVTPHLSQGVSIQVLSKARPSQFRQLPQAITWIQDRVEDDWFDAQGIFIAPIRSGSGMRIKLLEAMSRGKAIVTTTIGAQGLMVEHGKHMLIVDQPEDFALAIHKLLSDTGMRQGLGQAASEHAQKHFQDDVVSNELRSALSL